MVKKSVFQLKIRERSKQTNQESEIKLTHPVKNSLNN